MVDWELPSKTHHVLFALWNTISFFSYVFSPPQNYQFPKWPQKIQIRRPPGACGRNAEALWAAEALYREMMQLKGEPSLVTYGTAPWHQIPGKSPQETKGHVDLEFGVESSFWKHRYKLYFYISIIFIYIYIISYYIISRYMLWMLEKPPILENQMELECNM